jgi:heterodisulfide reductase subunit B
MKLAFFQGCNIPIRIEQYAVSATAVLRTFGIELETIDDFTCCGYPVRNVDETAYLAPSVRNIALAEKRGLDIMTICNCCFGSLQKARHAMAGDPHLGETVNELLAKDSLTYHGTGSVKHLLTVLHDEVGTPAIAAKLSHRYTELKVAVLHGCHLLRPREVTRFDDSFVPRITGELVQLTGAANLDWPGALECCGAALAGINEDLSRSLLLEKVQGARVAGAEFIVPVCAYCYLQLDSVQATEKGDPLPVLLYPQLLGLCLGLSPEVLGIGLNSSIADHHISLLESRLGPPTTEKKSRKKARATAAA